MKGQSFSFEGEGIGCVYNNDKWTICIKNWKPNNDINNIKYLEIHYKTDEQFILLNGKAILLAATRENDSFKIETIKMEPMKVYNIPKGTWFNTITEKNTKLVYIQDAKTSGEAGNSEYLNMTENELVNLRKEVEQILKG